MTPRNPAPATFSPEPPLTVSPFPRINDAHYREWLDSAIDPGLIRLNLISLDGFAPFDYLLYADSLPRRNGGRVSDGILKRYAHIENGGWWCGTIDPVTREASLWGCFKPDTPRVDLEKRKPIKYEHPPKVPTEAFFLVPTREIVARIVRRSGSDIYRSWLDRFTAAIDDYLDRYSEALSVEERREFDRLREIVVGGKRTGIDRYLQKLQPALDPPGIGDFLQGADPGFWPWAVTIALPLTITEGAKKAGALMSAGYAAIALPGIWNGIRTPKDGDGNPVGESYPIPALEVFTAVPREYTFCFDREGRPATAEAVREAIGKTGHLLARAGGTVTVVRWTHPEKGVDDLIAARGRSAYETIYLARQSLEAYRLRELFDLGDRVNLTVDRRYLDVEIPDDAPFIALKSAKGTGKTELMAALVGKALAAGRPVLVIGHRVRLMTELSNRFGINYRLEALNDELGTLLGYALCIDSLHPGATPAFDASAWEGAFVIIDEVEQVLWHSLSSSTCRFQRVNILASLQGLLRTALSTGGRLCIADADLSRVSIDYLKRLIGFPVDPWIVQNVHVPVQGKRKLYSFDGNDASELLAALVEAIERGERVFVCTAAREMKYRFSTANLEIFLKERFPDRPLLRIDRDTVSEPDHPAAAAMEDLGRILANYPIVLASPTIETGVSITGDLFNSVWGIASGVQTVNAVCQSLERIRADIPRYLWARSYSPLRIGNGSTNVRSLLKSEHESYRSLAGQLSFFDSIVADDTTRPESLHAWSEYALKVNAEAVRYRAALLEKLEAEGYEIVPVEPTGRGEEIRERLDRNKDENYRRQVEAIVAAPNPDDERFRELVEKRGLTATERLGKRKGELCRRYLTEDITAGLVGLDDDGWYFKIRLHYYLTTGREFLTERDTRSLNRLAEECGGIVFKPDVNRTLLTSWVRAFELLDLTRYLDPNVERSESDLEELRERLLPYRFQIRSVFGITVSEEGSAVKLLGAFLDRLGLKMKCIGRLGSRDERQRYYRLISLDPDGRGEIFARWRERDATPAETSIAPPVSIAPEPVPSELADSVEDARQMLETAVGEPVELTRDVMDAIVAGFEGANKVGLSIWNALSARARDWIRDIAPEGFRWLTG
ncbi:plasmid replication protein, CyRepA1 family [Pannus brasiliensis CCIBt3594]|uniref:Plasmid replication protein, CyRepA1 family n=1 Tax=Pannus brasiliensis CCIBt3594 TaxID=1427578 RepID=A0AAW9QYI3_9CHRO